MFNVEQIEQGLNEVRSAIAPGPGDARSFCDRVDTVLRVARALDGNDARRVALLGLIDRAWQRLDLTRPGSPLCYASIAAAEAALSEGLAALDTGEIRPTVVAVAHMGAGTAEAAAHTFATVLTLMDEYPELRFAHSSPQMYQFVKEDAPELYVRIRRQVEAGRWEVLGGPWGELDAHLAGGEALVRQILLGKRFARREFEVDPAAMWLPGASGLAGALPQLLVRSGIRYLITGGLGQGGGAIFPYDTFLWRGIDGSQVLVYNAAMTGSGAGNGNGDEHVRDLSPERVAAGWRAYRQKEVSDEILLPFGWDDGAASARATLEMARAQARLPGHPAVRLDTATAFLERLAARAVERELPVWDGEVCAGAGHRDPARERTGRRAQALYHDAEWLCSLAAIEGSAPYPHETLRAGWERLLAFQARDADRGAGSGARGDGAGDDEWVTQIGREALDGAQRVVAAGVYTEEPQVVVLNPLPWRRRDVVALPPRPDLAGKTLRGEDGRPLPWQEVTGEGGERQVLVEVTDVPAMGYRAHPLAEVVPVKAAEIVVTPRRLENAHYRIRLDDGGQIVSLFDKDAGREVLAPGARGNVLRIVPECPAGSGACGPDGGGGMLEIEGRADVAVEEAGPVRGALRLRRQVGESTIEQRLTIYRASRRIDFRTDVEWREPRCRLQVAFAADVRATFASYEVPFGTVERPTHRNTPGDAAAAGAPAGRWADLAEGNYGVALLSDGPQGYDVEGRVLALTLCGAPGRADEEGRHRFTYSLLPHAGTWREAGVAREAAALNHPLYSAWVAAQPGGVLPEVYELASVDAPNVTLETVKRAEDGDGWVVRLYEGEQCRRGAVTVTFGRAVRRAVECNLLEEATGPAAVDGRRLTFAVAPYEVKTFRVWFE